jgi:hypothetical protein
MGATLGGVEAVGASLAAAAIFVLLLRADI